MNTLDRVKAAVCRDLGGDPAKISDDASFVDDLGADSLDAVQVIMALEEEFGIEITDAEADAIRTVRDAAEFIDAQP